MVVGVVGETSKELTYTVETAPAQKRSKRREVTRSFLLCWKKRKEKVISEIIKIP